MMSSTKSTYRRQISMFPGKCEICGRNEDKFSCCKKCVTKWKIKYLKDELNGENH